MSGPGSRCLQETVGWEDASLDSRRGPEQDPNCNMGFPWRPVFGLSQLSLAQYCVEQPNRKESFTGESITIPCRFSYSDSENLITVSLAVKAANGGFCGSDSDIIYNSSKRIATGQYSRRLAVEFNLKEKTSLLTLKDLRSKDEQFYCCRLRIHFSDGNSVPWQHPTGTSVVVRGEKEMILEQENLILALTGDIVTIIARFSVKNQITIANVTQCAVFRSRKGNGCGNEIYPITCAQRNEENIVFLKINNTDDSHNGFYCFSMEVSVGEYNFIRRKHVRSQLLVLEPSRVSKINQTTEVEFMGPVIINCSFSVQDIISAYPVGDRITLWTEVYWMVGEPRQHFVYHPNEDYIHPEYRGKTKLIGQSDLLLEDFHGPDNTKFYCRVAMTFCLTHRPPNNMESILQEGPGTVVRVQDKVEPLTVWLQSVFVALFALFAVLSFLVLFIICVKARKAKMQIGPWHQCNPYWTNIVMS
ncbi:uncharacterized protein LOC143774818 [Ranitomeya variabilis]|uniref:uncharacterized protein LOC143774818 n=1 Tax=Ranitomeya variabilis TaxID=490064 RepID=UPI00405611AF